MTLNQIVLNRMVTATLFFVVAVAISLQQDVDGEYLIDGWFGLKCTMLFCSATSIWNVAVAFNTIRMWRL
jgi:hypothetical protein